MASGKGQNLLVWVIVFVVLTVVSGVTAFVFYQQTTKLTTEVANADNAKKEAVTAKTAADGQVALLKQRLGYEPLTDFGTPTDNATNNTVMGQTANDITRYGTTQSPSAQNYKDELTRLDTNVKTLTTQLDEKTKDYERLRADFDTQRKIEDAKVAQYAADTDSYKAHSAEVDAESKRKQDANDQKLQDTTRQANLISTRETQVRSEFTRYQNDNELTKDLLGKELRQFKDSVGRVQSAGSPVSSVVTVDNVSREVYIDRGDAHLLPLQTTFSVWASDKIGTLYWQDKNKKIKVDAQREFDDSNRKNYLATRLEAGPKAYIEIIAILGPNQAVGRITMDQRGNPIVPGDQLFSPIWEPGRKRHFVLAGRFDMTGKGTNDRTLLKELIKRQGGVIDAEVNDDGTIGGELQDVHVGTYMLVKGDLPDPNDPLDPLKDHAERIRTTSAELESKAKQLSVDVVDQQKFYDFMGYKVHSRNYELGKYTGAPTATNRFDNPSNTTRPSGSPQEGSSSRSPGIPGLSGGKRDK